MTMVIDVHAHFHTPATNRSDWQRYNASRLDAGDHIGVVCHVASVLGSWGATSPTYFASPGDQTRANDWMLDFADEQAPRVKAWVAVNPNFTAHALAEIERGVARGAIGIKLAAGRRADEEEEEHQTSTVVPSAGRALPGSVMATRSSRRALQIVMNCASMSVSQAQMRFS